MVWTGLLSDVPTLNEFALKTFPHRNSFYFRQVSSSATYTSPPTPIHQLFHTKIVDDIQNVREKRKKERQQAIVTPPGDAKFDVSNQHTIFFSIYINGDQTSNSVCVKWNEKKFFIKEFGFVYVSKIRKLKNENACMKWWWTRKKLIELRWICAGNENQHNLLAKKSVFRE